MYVCTGIRIYACMLVFIYLYVYYICEYTHYMVFICSRSFQIYINKILTARCRYVP